jgi:3-methyladenine DNA glycosylase/8-oxoguanine DNA glycosylase
VASSLVDIVEARLRPRGPYSLRLTTWTGEWRASLPDDAWAEARQLHDGTVIVKASSEAAVDGARFLLALDDDTSEFHRRFAQDPLLGRSVRSLRGLRPARTATVAHALPVAICGQLIQSSRARELERAVIRACGENPPTRTALARLSPAAIVGCGLAPSRAATLARLVRTIDLERLPAAHETALPRLRRERGIGPWSVGVIALRGLGRYDAGLVADLGLVKLQAALTGRWPDPAETAELLVPYEEWQGLASVFLLAGYSRGLIPGANPDRARLARARVASAA